MLGRRIAILWVGGHRRQRLARRDVRFLAHQAILACRGREENHQTGNGTVTEDVSR
jgi:hypothetical protein